MREVLRYRQISFDTAHVARPDQPFKATLFRDPSYPYVDSMHVTEFDEKHIVRWLMRCHHSRQIIFEELRLPPDAFYRPEVVQPFYAPGQGDIDLILWSNRAPHQALALECKRVKVEALNDGHDKINKLQNVGVGVHQANKFYNGRFGFFQTYLAIITEVAASAQDAVNIPNRGVRTHTTPQRGDTKTTTFKQIVEFPARSELHTDVGIVFIELVQPSGLSIDEQTTVRVCVYHRAERRDQPDSVTRRIEELAATNSN